MGKEIVNQVQETHKSPRQDKPQEEHTKTHNNETDKNERQINIKNKRKTTNNIQGNSHKVIS